jgi:hypothetical protein
MLEKIQRWLDDHYVNKDKAELRSMPVRLSASNQCPRRTAVLLREPVKRNLEAKRLRVFETGHQRGEALAKALVPGSFDEGYGAEIEREVWANIPVPGGMAEQIMERFREDPTWPLERLLHADEWPLRIRDDQLQVRGRADMVLWGPREPREPNYYSKAHQLRSYARNGPVSEFQARYAKKDHWVGVKDGKANLPWQCNYCNVGPILGQCISNHKLDNKGKPGQVGRWEIEL